jgi:hypothetical protein
MINKKLALLNDDVVAASPEGLLELADQALESMSGGRYHRPQPPRAPAPAPKPPSGGPTFGICIYMPGFRNPCNNRPAGVP